MRFLMNLVAIGSLLFLPGLARPEAVACRYGLETSPAGADGLNAVTTSHSLAVYYAVPKDVPFNAAVLARIKAATADIQAWYQCATGGLTWTLAFPETVRVYNASHNRTYYLNNGNWWGSLPPEMGNAGHPIWTSGTVSAIWAHGAGWWAGAAQSCGVGCGTALLGVELFPEFNNPAYSGGACPGGSGVGAWPCTPEGAYAHELGHTVGLPHPADVPATNAVAPHSIMQTHWNFPAYAAPAERPWGFLTLERQTLLVNPFLGRGHSVHQTHGGCETVNLPSTGAAPIAGFVQDSGVPGHVFSATNTSTGAAWSYWTFGDFAVGHEADAYHSYILPSTYQVTLRATATNGMIGAVSNSVPTVEVPTRQPTEGPAVLQAVPNPVSRSTTLQYRVHRPGVVDLALFDMAGRRVRVLSQGYRLPGTHAATWDVLDAGGEPVPSGIYVCRLRAAGWTESVRLVVNR